MRSIRAATFEVVLKKPEADPLTYERPLPLELIPFAQRNDKYESIGTAFAIGPGRFVTAAHVTLAASGSMWGAPALRDAEGNVYPLENVTRFSMHEDFIEFTVTHAPDVRPLPTSIAFRVDTPVVAVGNALGQGIVARDGLLTSETPEEQDGRWNWLRFSAPASPGNSGGPLLDTSGRVIGLIARKSANENLNYALPIARVLEARTDAGLIDVRYTVAMPVITSRKVVQITTSIPLPLPFAEFDRQLIAASDQHATQSRDALLAEAAGDTFPRGKSDKLLADTFIGANPGFLMQQPDGRWDMIRNPNIGTNTQLGADGVVWTLSNAGAMVFRIDYPNDIDHAKSRADGKLLGEQILAGLNASRTVGTERVRITSLGDPGEPELIKDELGRTWRLWHYPMPYADSTMIVAALPMPDGAAGFLRQARGAGLARTAAEMREMMNFLQATYSGRPVHWKDYMTEKQFLPEAFADWTVQLTPGGQAVLQFPRLSLQADKDLLGLVDRSLLSVVPGILMDDGKPVWDVLGLQLRAEARGAPQFIVHRRPRPGPDAGLEATSRWQQMIGLRGLYTGAVGGDQNNFWVRRVAAPAGIPIEESDVLYELMYVTPTVIDKAQLERAGTRLPEMFRILE